MFVVMSLHSLTIWLCISATATAFVARVSPDLSDLNKGNDLVRLDADSTSAFHADLHQRSHDSKEGTPTQPELSLCAHSADATQSTDHHRDKRFTLYENLTYTWTDPRTPFPLTVGFMNYLAGDISTDVQDEIAIHCATIWAEVSGLSFKFVGQQIANIHISFDAIGGDPGAGGTVGEAGPPRPEFTPPSTYLRIDNRERWKPRVSTPGIGLSLEEVICHEMGHTLGLGHTNVTDALMYTIVGGKQHDARLDTDDINGIQSLYGLPNGQTVVDENGQAMVVTTQTEMGSARSQNCTGRRRTNCRSRNGRNNRQTRKRSASRRRSNRRRSRRERLSRRRSQRTGY